jgi:hypothetical protein
MNSQHHREANFTAPRPMRKSPLPLGLLPESVIRHTQVKKLGTPLRDTACARQKTERSKSRCRGFGDRQARRQNLSFECRDKKYPNLI